MKKSLIALAEGQHRQTTDFQESSMATYWGGSDSDHAMETVMGTDDQPRSYTDEVRVRMFGEEGPRWDATPATIMDTNQRNPTRTHTVWEVDEEDGVHALSQEHVGHSHVAVPAPFSGLEGDFKKFQQQVKLYITANKWDFRTDKAMILFALLYMMEGLAELWANAYVNKSLEEENWGLWENFLEALSRDFGDVEEPQHALEEMGRLFQGKGTAADYLLWLEQLAGVAGVDVNRSSHVILQVKWGINSSLIDQLYLSDEAPQHYTNYKHWIVAMDEMHRRCEVNKKHTYWSPVITRKDPAAMEVDMTTRKSTDQRKCYKCGKEGHLIRGCPEKETKQELHTQDF
jgi:hypothetical protein